MPKICYNSSTVKKNLLERLEEAIDDIFARGGGFGEIRVVINKKRKIFDVLPCPRIRCKDKNLAA